MILPRFDVLIPETIEEACHMLRAHIGDGARVLAGGTDLLVDLRKPIVQEHLWRCEACAGHPQPALSTADHAHWPVEHTPSDWQRESPRYLISLHMLGELRSIDKSTDGGLRVGALATATDIERSELVRATWTALAEGADSLGSPLVRNKATIGGNIANARPAADTFVPSIALSATLSLRGPDGRRTIAAKDFALGPGVSVMQPDEILTHIDYPAPEPHSGSAYYKMANRKALEISMVGVAVYLALEHPKGPISDACIALGAVGPTPILAPCAREALVGRMPGDTIFGKAALAAASDARPIDDHRGSAAYRRQMVELLTERMLKVALVRAGGEA